MVALIVGLLFIAFSVVAVIPGIPGFGWWDQVINFLKGGAPVLAVFIGLIAIFIGIADIKDRIEAKKEEAEEAKQAEKQAETK
jgi:flagellar biosynthesis/type III secretory pathway M-ring protein FliF/YscJ